MNRPEPPGIPGLKFEVVPDEGWTMIPEGVSRRCRSGSMRHGERCPNPGVAFLERRHGPFAKRPWAYCELHLFGRWIEPGPDGSRVMTWRAIPPEV